MTGTEHVPREGGVLLAYNHISYVDFIYGGLAANPSGRLVRFMAKRELFDHRCGRPAHALAAPHRGGPRRGDRELPRRRRLPAPGRGRRHLPRGHHLPRHGAQGVQDRGRTHRRGGRRTRRARHPVGHPADDDQGPPPRLLPGQDHRHHGRRADAPDRRQPRRRHRPRSTPGCRRCSATPIAAYPADEQPPARGGCRPRWAAPPPRSRRPLALDAEEKRERARKRAEKRAKKTKR